MSRILPVRLMLAAVLTLGAVAAPPTDLTLKPGPWIVVEDGLGRYESLAVDPTAHRLLAAHVNDDTADIFDLDANKLIARVSVGPIVDIAVDSNARRYFASVQDDKRIAIIDAQSLKETSSIALPGETGALVFTAKNRRIYIAHDLGKTVWVVDPDARKLITSIPVAKEPESMAYDAATDRLYLSSSAADLVSVINTTTNTVVATWPTHPATSPHGVALDVARHRIFVAGENGLLLALDTSSGSIVASVAIGEQTGQIAFDAALQRVYCAGPNWITVVQSSGATLTTIDRIYTAATAKNVAVDPATHAVWSTFTDGEDSFAKSWLPR